MQPKAAIVDGIRRIYAAEPGKALGAGVLTRRLKCFKDEVQDALNYLLERGEIYPNCPGKYKPIRRALLAAMRGSE